MTAPELTDETAFSALVERHRRELQVHCYRMLGSFEEAEDLTQETFLRAWRRRETYAGRASLRAWLYRIATNACLDALEKRPRKPSENGEVLWLQPIPDELLAELPSDAEEPDAEVVARETIELAYMVAIQHLPPRTRAVLILRDALGWRARDTAELLEMSEAAVNSALQRARAGLKEHLPTQRSDWESAELDEADRALLEQYMRATELGDAKLVAETLAEDVRFTMPPQPGLWVGRDARRRRLGGRRLRRPEPDRRLPLHAHVRQPPAGGRQLPARAGRGHVPRVRDRRPDDRRGPDRRHHDLRRAACSPPSGCRQTL